MESTEGVLVQVTLLLPLEDMQHCQAAAAAQGQELIDWIKAALNRAAEEPVLLGQPLRERPGLRKFVRMDQRGREQR